MCGGGLVGRRRRGVSVAVVRGGSGGVGAAAWWLWVLLGGGVAACVGSAASVVAGARWCGCARPSRALRLCSPTSFGGGFAVVGWIDLPSIASQPDTVTHGRATLLSLRFMEGVRAMTAV